MQQEAMEPSAAGDLVAQPFEVVELPMARTGDGQPFRMRLAPPPIEGVIRVLKGLPPAGKDPEAQGEDETESSAGEKTEAAVEALEKQMKDLLDNGAATNPPITFDADAPGALRWQQLHLRDRGFLVARLVRLAGIGPTVGDGLGSFRHVRGRGAVRPPGDAGVPAAAAAAPGDPRNGGSAEG